MAPPSRLGATGAVIALVACSAEVERLPVPGPLNTPAGSPAWTLEVDSGRDTAQPAETPALPTEVPLSAAMGFAEDGLLLVALGGRDELRAGRPDEGIWTAEQDLPPQSWPFRLATFEKRVRVVLRGPGVVASYGLPGLEPRGQMVYCPEPRGIDADPWEPDTWWLACAGGELLHLQGDEPNPLLRVQLPVDLRDVVVREDRIWISRFQRAELLEVDRSGALLNVHLPPPGSGGAAPVQAYRLVSSQVNDRILMAHGVVYPERLSTEGGSIVPSRYSCSPIVAWTFTSFRTDGLAFPSASYASRVMDVAQGPDGIVLITTDETRIDPLRTVSRCFPSADDPPARGLHALAVAASSTQSALVLEVSPETRITNPYGGQPRPLPVPGRTVTVPAGQASLERSHNGVSCASCHPEGGADGRVWLFPAGPRRTLPARPTGPLGWQAQWADLPSLLSSHTLNWEETDPRALEGWLRSLPAPRPPPLAGSSQSKGEQAFLDLGCHGCHQGSTGDSDRLVWLTPDAPGLSPPSLQGLAGPGPFGHDGRYANLEQVFIDAPPEDPHHLAARGEPETFSALTAWLRSR